MAVRTRELLRACLVLVFFVVVLWAVKAAAVIMFTPTNQKEARR